MKKVALTAVAVLGLGLAACQDNAPDNNASTVNTIESEAEADTNAATNEAAAADSVLNNLGESAGNVGDAAANVASNAGNAIENATTNNQ
jgi:hypothetical protein